MAIDYRGAQGSNAGDDFHELWALYQSLAMLDSDSGLFGLTVEGVLAEEKNGSSPDTWDGVDCVLYYGDGHDNIERIVIAQLKYSAANPSQNWTISRLVRGGNKSIIGKLAKAFDALRRRHPNLIETGNLIVRLVSNQPVSDDLSDLSSNHNTVRDRLVQASNLNPDNSQAFISALDFSECGSGSRFVAERKILSTISEWTEDDARTAVNDLMRFIGQAMMPQSQDEFITRHSILAHLGFSDERALFPCPSDIKDIEQPVKREISSAIAQRILSGSRHICLHGGAGCGKTTAIQEIREMLPAESVLVVYDCYGSGRYMDSDAYRHRHKDAFLQLSNELAIRLRTPLLVTQSRDRDYPRVFKWRLEKAAEVISAKSDSALLVIVVDAADNSVTAASSREPEEQSFIQDFMALGELPPNVCFIVTARTARLTTLNLAEKFEKHEVTGFSREDTAEYVLGKHEDVAETWTADFHGFSRGNPRVQKYAFDFGGDNLEKVLGYLQPHGKSLDRIFQDRFSESQIKVGDSNDITTFCAGIIALPRAIPVTHLVQVTGLSEEFIQDLCIDLHPGLHLNSGLIEFADEDFENFILSKVENNLASMQTAVADHFFGQYQRDAYAATHVAAALSKAGHRQKIIELLKAEQEPAVIQDPVLRREVQLQRFRIAMKACRETGNIAEALLTILGGAEAMNTDKIIKEMLFNDLDLAACFARESLRKLVLREPDEMPKHGPALCQLMAVSARAGNDIAVRENMRQFHAWMSKRQQDLEEQRESGPHHQHHAWDISIPDIAASIEAVIRIQGPVVAINDVLRWTPRDVALDVALILVPRLIASGDIELIEECLQDERVSAPWDIFLLVPLALSGRDIDVSRLEKSLASPMLRRVFRLYKPERIRAHSKADEDYIDLILTACEVAVALKANHDCITPILKQLAIPDLRQTDALKSMQANLIDWTLRAYALLEAIDGREATIEKYLVRASVESEDSNSNEANHYRNSQDNDERKLRETLGPLVNIYNTCAQVLVGAIDVAVSEAKLQNAIDTYRSKIYYMRDHRGLDRRTLAALAITRLVAVRDFAPDISYKSSQKLLATHSLQFDSQGIRVYSALVLVHSLHEKIAREMSKCAETVQGMKMTASEKVEVLTKIARVIFSISQAEAEVYYGNATQIVDEVDIHAIYELGLFEQLARHAVESMDIDQKRQSACDLAIVSEDTYQRLDGYDHFPWEDIASALTTLDVSIALAAVSRWDDAGLVGHKTMLPSVLFTGIESGVLSSTQTCGLLAFLDVVGTTLILQIMKTATGQQAENDLIRIAENLAREELLRFGRGTRPEVTEALSTGFSTTTREYWLSRLCGTTQFIQENKKSDAVTDATPYHATDGNREAQTSPIESVDWDSYRFTSTESINEVIHQIRGHSDGNTYVDFQEIFNRMRGVVRYGDQVKHLNALTNLMNTERTDTRLAQAIADCLNMWEESPAITEWCQQSLLPVIVKQLPGFIGYLPYGESPLPELLTKCGKADTEICDALLTGVQQHVDRLHSETIYALVGLIAGYCKSDDISTVLERRLKKLKCRIPENQREVWNLNDIPEDVAGGLTHFLYALMGDVDVRTRWRAAHALRRLVLLGENDLLEKIIDLYDWKLISNFRNSDAPFYWLAARLWLVITLDRIATENPSVLEEWGRWLFKVATDDTFPHLLVRKFAKSATNRLIENKILTLNKSELGQLNSVNVSALAKQKKSEPSGTGSFHETSGRRFRFDTLDTTRYWYAPLISIFADMDMDRFLDIAEHWIIDQWGAQEDPWNKDKPRGKRLDHRWELSSNSHGSMPTLERFRTYLEWHAMWCATGELLRTEALVKSEEYPDNKLETLLKEEGLSLPPLWLADLHGAKPLKYRFWFSPEEVNLWLEHVDNTDFFSEIMIGSDDQKIIVSSDYLTRSNDFSEEVQVNTALVSPDPGLALLRALQTVDNRRCYVVPTVSNNHCEIDHPPYRFIGWLVYGKEDSGIDKKDVLRYGITGTNYNPPNILAGRNLDFIFNNDSNYAEWIDRSSGKQVFVYEAWGDTQGDEPERESQYDTRVRSSGWRLLADKMELKKYLNERALDLLVEITITRRNKGYEYSRYDQEKALESEYDRVLIFRRDGSIDAVEGCIGTWYTPDP